MMPAPKNPEGDADATGMHAAPSEARPSPRRGGSPPPLELIVMTGTDEGRRHRLEPPAVVGRGEDADIIIDDAQVSRAHVRMARDERGALTIVDLDSRNGTAVGELPLVAGRPVLLPLGAVVELGARVTVVVKEEAAAEDDATEDARDGDALRRQRLETSGKLASAVARDLADRLCAAMASLDVLRSLPGVTSIREDIVRGCLDDVAITLESSVGMLPQLLTLGSRQPNRNLRCDMSRIVQDIATLATRSFGPQVSVRHRLDPDLVVKGDSAELYHAVMHLCLVLRDAVDDRDGGRLFLGARRKLLSRFDQRRGRLVLTAQAEAVGLREAPKDDADVRSVQRVVALHGGRFKAAHDGDKHSYYIELALVDAPRMRRGTVASFAAVGRGPVLVVHDALVVRRALARVLETAGVTPLTATRDEVVAGEVALEAMQAAVVDDEAASAEVIAAILAHVGVGRVAQLGGSGPSRAGMQHVIRLPWSTETVLQVVDRMLDAERAGSAEETLA